MGSSASQGRGVPRRLLRPAQQGLHPGQSDAHSPIAWPAPPVPARVANQLAPRVLRCAGAMCVRVCVAWGAADGDNFNTNTQHGGLLL